MQQQKTQSQNEIWFDNIKDAKPLGPDDFKTFEDLVTSSVKANKFNPNNLKIKDSVPRIVFISIAEFAVTATVFHGQGYGIVAAFELAFNRMQKRFDCSDKRYTVKLDMVTSQRLQQNCDTKIKYNFIKGIEGVAFAKEFDLAMLPDQASYNYLWNNDFQMSTNRIYNFLEKNPPETQKFANVLRNNKFDIHFFKTQSYLLEKDELTPLYRGQHLFKDFSLQYLKDSACMGGQYLINSILPNGRFDYIYHADTNNYERDYNFLRHAGTCFSLAEYLEFSQDKECLPALKRALEYMKLFGAPGLEDPQTTCFIERGLVKVGGNGLAALALAKYIKVTGDDKDMELLRKICNWILTQTQEDGNFKGHKQYYHDGSYSSKTVLYYPGEVIYGLVMSYHLMREEKWMDAANRIAHWMINVRDKGVENIRLEHDHWLLYGLYELHKLTPHQIYIEHTVKICQAIMHRHILSSEYPDYVGAHNNRRDPSSTQAATRSEGLLAAYKLLRDYGNMPEFAAKVMEYAQRSVCFQLRTQYTTLNTMYIHNAAKALGGFRAALNTHDIRIDYVQHNISSLISLYNILSSAE